MHHQLCTTPYIPLGQSDQDIEIIPHYSDLSVHRHTSDSPSQWSSGICACCNDMLIRIPGKKPRHIESLGTTPWNCTISTQSSCFNVQSPRLSGNPNKSRNISSYIHLEHVISLSVKQSQPLSLSTLGIRVSKQCQLETWLRIHASRAVQKFIETLRASEQFSMVVSSLKPGMVW